MFELTFILGLLKVPDRILSLIVLLLSLDDVDVASLFRQAGHVFFWLFGLACLIEVVLPLRRQQPTTPKPSLVVLVFPVRDLFTLE